MKRILILVSLSLFGCANSTMPAFPDIKDHYLVEVRDETVPPEILRAIENIKEIHPMQATEVVRCLKFEIVNKIPYKIKFISQVAMKECNGVGGFKPVDAQSLLNWLDDVASWAQTKRNCFK